MEAKKVNLHPRRDIKKERGWGRMKTILVYSCEGTGKTVRIVKNWRGPVPPGAIICPHCGGLLPL